MDAFINQHLSEVTEVINRIDRSAIRAMVDRLAQIRAQGGRLFFLGVGGSAGSCSHAVNDFRKLCGIESYSPIDNVSELTARINDEGWENCFADWLKVSRLKKEDALFILSVGGGSAEKNVSPNLVKAIDYAKSAGASVLGIVGRDGGYTARQANACVIIPTVNSESITPHTEAFHAVVWHLLVSHPDLKSAATKWESVAKK
jgi:D-sedoheptulose 7-phosphate isomerase